MLHSSSWERGVRICERNNYADTKASEEGGGGDAPGALQPVEVHGGADMHLQPMEDPMPEQVEAREGGCGPWEAHTGASFWQDLWTRGERSPHWSRFAGRTCDPVGDPHWSSLLLKVCTLWKGPTME
ncbi:zinc finger and BTB domain-containing protein 5 [Grus japonensis]|uniref:Zinc finger and BTB domain-containing protein 5 n=1 Tax=Grus japonensis TaxID=30415 RepID=A0ABC9WLD1_GRUJA